LKDKRADEEIIAWLNHLADNFNDGGGTLAKVDIWYEAAVADMLYLIQDSKDEAHRNG